MEKKNTESYLVFRLQGELFAVSVHKVLEIIETDDEHTITYLPKASESIAGVVNFRGNVIPVLDTRMKFDMRPYEEDDKFVVIVLNLNINNSEHFVGAKADKVIDVLEITEDEIKPVPEVGQGYNSDFIKGVIHRDNRFLMLLNLEATMGTEDIISLKKPEIDELVEADELGTDSAQ